METDRTGAKRVRSGASAIAGGPFSSGGGGGAAAAGEWVVPLRVPGQNFHDRRDISHWMGGATGPPGMHPPTGARSEALGGTRDRVQITHREVGSR